MCMDLIHLSPSSFNLLGFCQKEVRHTANIDQRRCPPLCSKKMPPVNSFKKGMTLEISMLYISVSMEVREQWNITHQH